MASKRNSSRGRACWPRAMRPLVCEARKVEGGMQCCGGSNLQGMAVRGGRALASSSIMGAWESGEGRCRGVGGGRDRGSEVVVACGFARARRGRKMLSWLGASSSQLDGDIGGRGVYRGRMGRGHGVAPVDTPTSTLNSSRDYHIFIFCNAKGGGT